MSWFKRKEKKPPEVDPAFTYYGDKRPTIVEQIAKLIQDPKFVGIERASTTTFKITIRVLSGSSWKNLSYTESLERVMHWAGATLERDKNGIRQTSKRRT